MSSFTGRVYKLISSHTDEIYIGSTEASLSNRLNRHKCDYKNYINGKKNYISSYEILKYADVKIELIHEGEFSTKREFRRLEGSFIRQVDNCVNKRVEARTGKEYYENNKEAIQKQCKEYDENNKEAIQKQRKENYKNNKDQIIQKSKEYYGNNKETVAQYKKKWRDNNKEKICGKHTCPTCGGSYTHASNSSHERSQKHNRALEEAKTIIQPEEEPVS